MPGIPALQLRGFAELDRTRLVSASKAKTFQLTGQTLLQKVKLERLTRRKQKPNLTISNYSLAAIIPQQESLLQIG